MITEEAISDRISQISQIVSAYILPFNTGKDTKFLGKDVQVYAGIERAQLEDIDCSMCSIHDTTKFDSGECANDHDLCVLGMTEWLGQEAGSIMKSYIE